jgi:dienelactone hydrolase
MKKSRFAYLVTTFILSLSLTQAALKKESVVYESEGQKLEGYLVYDDAVKKNLPGVLIVHQWKGLIEYEKKRAEMLAELGYVVFCADIYGQGIRPTEMKDCAAESQKYKKNRALYRQRLAAGLDQLRGQATVDKSRLAVMGYCFGGTGALEAARAGAEVRGVVSFHGGLNTEAIETKTPIKPQILVLHGADDPYVPAAEVEAFKAEMTTTKAQYEFIAYPGAVHSFTHWDAGTDNSKGAAYNEEADKKSWEAMKEFFQKIFR